MPELPEIEVICRTLKDGVLGKYIASMDVGNPAMRWPVPVSELGSKAVGQRVVDLFRRGKYVCLKLSNDYIVAIHLGMSGALLMRGDHEPSDKFDNVAFSFRGGGRIALKDHRRFGSVHLIAADELKAHPRFVHLGFEPLAGDFEALALKRSFGRSSRAIKQVIMDQKVVVGVGNIYAAEILFRARVHPFTPARRLGLARVERMVEVTREVLARAIQCGGTSFRDYVDGYGRKGNFVDELQVYGRKGLPCLICQRPLKGSMKFGRSTVYCTRCQKG
ncbi:MAG: bifunctional DNA-formamidopyrimidine glycosylase/DNA-(apurinic or apyrimidinic site) lyase [Myxococcota bacterium]|nr:bifunctional DNA-formamidopyrimidine glycosylase/DNA-(apurinic or apyrimidinic site) lyase [Myxococcota bacterium]